MNHAFALNANVWLIVAGALIVASWWTIVILGRTSGTFYHLNNWKEEKTHEMGEYFSLRFAWLGMIHDMIRFLIKNKYWSMTMRHAWFDDKLISTSYAMYNFDEWNFENEPNNNNKKFLNCYYLQNSLRSTTRKKGTHNRTAFSTMIQVVTFTTTYHRWWNHVANMNGLLMWSVMSVY